MKIKYYLLVLCIPMLISFTKQDPEDQVKIPDDKFLYAIIAGGFDTDGDSIISKAEAEAVSNLSLGDMGISDLAGIEAFVNLRGLVCSENQLTHLDVSANRILRTLRCNNNQLKDLDVSRNTALTMLNCRENQLSSLDVSQNLYLRSLCCDANLLTRLDLSGNKSIYTLSIGRMPTLNEVCVWTMPFPPEGLNLTAEGSPNITFTTDCGN